MTALVPDVTAAELRTIATTTLHHLTTDNAAGVVLATTSDGKAHLAAAINAKLSDRGTQARQILSEAASTIGGGAGGTGPIASAGGRNTAVVNTALAQAQAALVDAISR